MRSTLITIAGCQSINSPSPKGLKLGDGFVDRFGSQPGNSGVCRFFIIFGKRDAALHFGNRRLFGFGFDFHVLHELNVCNYRYPASIVDTHLPP